jgi:CDP-4-dehydro-6-deoxyglucose reductase
MSRGSHWGAAREPESAVTQWLTLWRAAQLVGVSRGVLQKRIREGELASNEGLVSSEELLRCYPQAELEDSGAFERVSTIKETAFARRVRERTLPSQEVLAQRLFAQSQELADVRRHLQRYHQLVIALQERIHALACDGGGAALRTLDAFVGQGLAEVLATESADVLAIMDDMLKVMSAHVRVRPSGHEFLVEGRNSLLEAGLRAGLKLNYGCGNGTCGLCKARLVSGLAAPLRPHDYTLSEAERAQGYTLLCTQTAASSELVIEALEASGPQDLPEQQVVTRVRAITPLAPSTLELHLQTARSNRFRFLAGQSVTLGLAGEAGDAHATYPVASCPCDDRNLHFYIARNADDPFAERLFAGALKTGDAVSVLGPEGDFVLADSRGQLVFAACDMGISAVRSLIEHAVAIDAAEGLSLYWLATRPDGHFLGNLCRAWDEALDQFDYSLHTGTEAGAGAAQVVAAIRMDRFVMQCDVYLAGPQAFVAVADGALRAAGLPQRQIFATVVE